jgi:hypothetical protein
MSASPCPGNPAPAQHPFTISATLPTDLRHDTREVLERAGVVFGDSAPGEPLLTQVTLPEGWRVVSTNRPTWFLLVDEKGRQRALVIYELKTSAIATTRFGVTVNYGADGNAVGVNVIDADEVRFTIKPRQVSEPTSAEYHAAEQAAKAEAMGWLREHYPNWQDSSAYWD